MLRVRGFWNFQIFCTVATSHPVESFAHWRLPDDCENEPVLSWVGCEQKAKKDGEDPLAWDETHDDASEYDESP